MDARATRRLFRSERDAWVNVLAKTGGYCCSSYFLYVSDCVRSPLVKEMLLVVAEVTVELEATTDLTDPPIDMSQVISGSPLSSKKRRSTATSSILDDLVDSVAAISVGLLLKYIDTVRSSNVPKNNLRVRENMFKIPCLL